MEQQESFDYMKQFTTLKIKEMDRQEQLDYLKQYEDLLEEAAENETIARADEKEAIEAFMNSYPYIEEKTARYNLECMMKEAIQIMDPPQYFDSDWQVCQVDTGYKLYHKIYAQRRLAYPPLLCLYFGE
jgi:hypothetical protein